MNISEVVYQDTNHSTRTQAGPSIIEALTAEASAGPAYRVLRVETANAAIERAAMQPVPEMLFSECWFEGEVCFLFADTGAGKSLLALQIADSLTTGRPIDGFKMNAEPKTVLYLDFELSEKQTESRYSDAGKDRYHFSSRLIRLSVDPDKIDISGEIEASLKVDISTAIDRHRAEVVIVDNLTWLATDTLPFMKSMKSLQREYGVSILLLAHTPKISEARPISNNDMAGSKQLMNFVDSAFALGKSHKDPALRYLKQIKVRVCEFVFTSKNVAVMRIEKPRNFTGLRVVEYCSEYEHLRPLKEVEQEITVQKVLDLKRCNPEMSNRAIAEKAGTNHTQVGRILKSVEPSRSTEVDSEPF